MKTNNPATGFIGIPIDEEGNEIKMAEEEHFHVCDACGQAVDRRDLGQVFHHEEPNHTKLLLDT